MNRPIIEVKGLKRSFKTQAGELEVLKNVDLQIRPGEIVGLIGPSGSGKSSLLHSIGLLEEIQSGQIIIDGEDVTNKNDKIRTNIRRDFLGFVYQFHNLLPELNARENIALPLEIAGRSREIALNRADELLALMGLSERAGHRPAQLSGGEQQRVAIARAIANRPKVLLADEPTGNLDPKTSQIIFELFAKIAKEEGVAALVGTHNLELADKMDRVVGLENGILIEQ